MDPGNKRYFFLPSCTETEMSSLFKFILLFSHDGMDPFMHIALHKNTLREVDMMMENINYYISI